MREVLVLVWTCLAVGMILVGCGTAPVAPSNGSDVVVARARGPIIIDGKLDEPSWKHATEYATWYTLNETKPVGPDAPRTSVRMLWDDKYLYFALVCEDRDLDMTVMPRDGEVYFHDCVELFIQPSARWNMYWELEFSPAGSVMDAFIYKEPGRYAFGENMKGLQSKPALTGPADKPTGYIVEVAVPLDELPCFNLPPKPGETFRMLAARINTDKAGQNTRMLTFVPTTLGFHTLKCYATARLAP